jgi:hypothetical protein
VLARKRVPAYGYSVAVRDDIPIPDAQCARNVVVGQICLHVPHAGAQHFGQCDKHFGQSDNVSM